jgi:hypothetical protein
MNEYYLPYESFDTREKILIHLVQPNYPMNYYMVLPVIPIFAHITYGRVADIIIDIFEKSRGFISKLIEHAKQN